MIGRRVPVAHLAEGERLLEGAVAHYLGRVLRLHPGDAFVAFDPATAREADALTLRAEGDSIAVRFGPTRKGATLAPRPLTWIQALAKGDKCDAVVRDATELGATRIVIAVTERSVVKLQGPRAQGRVARWTKIAEEAARQSGRSDVPVVNALVGWQEAVAGVSRDEARFCLWGGAADTLGPALFDVLAQRVPIAFACGPEGGLTPAEVDFGRERGFAIATLGPRTLRTETVAAAVLGAVRVWAGPFGG